MCKRLILRLFLFVFMASLANATTPTTHDELYKEAEKLQGDGNFKEAYDLYHKLCLDPEYGKQAAGQALRQAIHCLQNINRVNETDELLEKAIALRANDWRFLESAALTYYSGIQKHGYIVAGKFERGHHRGGGRPANSMERNRTRALQLFERARKLAITEEASGTEIGNLALQFAQTLMQGHHESWRLQVLTDLSTLPDYEDGYYYYRHDARNAPVDAEGNPVFHKLPENYETATTDGERWRALLKEAVQYNPDFKDGVLLQMANFAYTQFSVQTMREYGWFFHRTNIDGDTRDAAFTLDTLGNNETMARLATGIKRFNLPDEWNYIAIYRDLANRKAQGEHPINRLAEIYENRRQFDRAVDCWKENIKKHGDSRNKWKQKRIDQIVDNWGIFEAVSTYPAGKNATIEFRFRNGKKVHLEAKAIDTQSLLTDVKHYLMTNPRRIEHEKVNISNIGYRLIHQDGDKYIGDTVAKWTEALEPRPNHFDRRVTLTTPLKDAGAYLLTATMEDGNVSTVVIWITDTVIAQKHMDGKPYYFVADAATGEPVPDATLEFFGYRYEYKDNRTRFTRQYDILTSHFAEKTNANGEAIPEADGISNNYQWLITATTPGKGEPDEVTFDRFAFIGFTHMWNGRRHDSEYNATKVFTITDRPVYRPNQTVKYKLWVRHAQYDKEFESQFADRTFTLRIFNPKNEKIEDKQIKTDAYGGLDGEIALPDEATLGVYRIQLVGIGGQGTFRVEEYKKPEFEVSVDAPDKPIMLGESITAKVKANYYFGAPVTEAKVTIKVLRSEYNANWYPVGIWDWFYGPGYWWFGYDYIWYPGWREWGCFRPRCWWWPTRHQPPEVVAQLEQEIGKDGTVSIDIDTALAKAMHGDTDHRYEITAEVRDKSRRTIVGKGSVLVAREPFKVYAWTHRGHYRQGDTIQASFSAHTLDNKPIVGEGKVTLSRLRYKDLEPIEKVVEEWDLPTGAEGHASLQIKAAKPGQYRLSYAVTDSAGHTREGAQIFVVMGDDRAKAKSFRFNAIELVPEKREYAAGETVKLRINTEQENSTVVLFLRPTNGVYLQPEVLKLEGKSKLIEIPVTKKDMPNFFVEAMTISDGKLHTETREIVVPPEKRVLNVELQPSKERFKPGEAAQLTLRLTDLEGLPFVGSTVLSVYDKSVEYISGGSNVPEIRAHFWKWRRHHNPSTLSSLDRHFANVALPKKDTMRAIGIFGHLIADEGMDFDDVSMGKFSRQKAFLGGEVRSESVDMMKMAAAPMPMSKAASMEVMADKEESNEPGAIGAGGGNDLVEPTVRSEFADTAFWAAALTTDSNGVVTVNFDMPENLTTWRVKAWAMGHGTKVGEGVTDIITTKNLLIRLQAPRFFVEKDVVVLSANIHNYLETTKSVKAVLELDGETLEAIDAAEHTVQIEANGEQRVDWKVRALREGEATIRMKALSDEESDAMEMSFPVYVHGMLKTESFSGVIRRDGQTATVQMRVPKERRVEQTRLEVRYSPTLAGAMVDALPYLVSYPYGCTEQTLNRFLPSVITQRILLDSGIDLAAVREKQTNLNAQEIGDDKERAAQWNKWKHDPVFDEDEVARMVKAGLNRLTSMQNSDGGWGWFSGYSERSYAHTTATVIHGLQVAKANGAAVVPGVIENGLKWLRNHQDEQVDRLKKRITEDHPRKLHADNLDAFVFMVLVDGGINNEEMAAFLYRDRNDLSVYGKSMVGMAFNKLGKEEELAMIMRNIEQYLVIDDENQTAWLNLQNGGYWWYWYGSEFEAHAYYLKLLAATDPKSDKAAGLVKYLLNNRKHATYWNSTRDTALCIEALADYLRASEEDKPDMTLEIFVDGDRKKEVTINSDNLFSFDNKLVLEGSALMSGKHEVELRRSGTGPVYFNAYLSNFTLEDPITRAGLEIKVLRKVYRLERDDKQVHVSGARGQALSQRVERYKRIPLSDRDTVTSGDLIEVELEIESKNDYEYILIEDMKAAGFEPVDVRSGYIPNDLGAYVEFRDERVAFLVRQLARGKHSVSYRLRAEVPGTFSALPTRASAMYAPELKANSDEIKLNIADE